MKNLHIHNLRLITYSDDLFTIDVLGGVDVEQVERMICTLRIRYENYPPLRSTLDLYSDPQCDQLIRSLCDKWKLVFVECSRSIHAMVMQLEEYRFERLRYPKQVTPSNHQLTKEQQQQAIAYLSAPRLMDTLQGDLNHIGLPKGDDTALILFLAMASRSYSRPLSVLCTSEGNNHYLIFQKLSACLPEHHKSMHTHISDNALYYFEPHQVDGKVLFIEDVQWTPKMLQPLSALHSTGRLTKTQATKNKDGLLYATTFELDGKLCMIACTSASLKIDQGAWPFLTLSLQPTPNGTTDRMLYEKQCRAGLIDPGIAIEAQERLRGILQSLSNVTIRNPYAPLIELPPETEHPERTMVLLLDVIEVITFFHQHQREQHTDPDSGEIYIESQPEDVALAFRLLKRNLLASTDDVSTPAKAFYEWLQGWMETSDQKTFTASDIRKQKHIHPRSLNRYLKELCYFHYLTISGGNKYRGGYRYRLTNLPEMHRLQVGEEHFETILQQIKGKQQAKPRSRTVGQKPVSKPTTPKGAGKRGRTTHNGNPPVLEATPNRASVKQKLNGTS